MPNKEEQRKDKELRQIIELTAPGTFLRDGLENVLRANTGGLIVIGDKDNIAPLVEGGFDIAAPYSPAHLYELAKMDGAIILSKDAGRILIANAHLNPDPSIPSSETGIRHRTAEQTARQTGELVISISQRRRVISLYKSDIKYVIRDISMLLTTANLAVQTLEKYRNALERALLRLSVEEFDNLTNADDVIEVIQRAEMVKRVEWELIHYIRELGSESRLIKMQTEELLDHVDEDERNTIRDYITSDEEESEEVVDAVLERLRNLSSEDVLNRNMVARILGIELDSSDDSKMLLSPKGYRLLNKIPRLPSHVIDNLIGHFGTLSKIAQADVVALDEVEGVGPKRAEQISTGLERLRLQTINDSHWD